MAYIPLKALPRWSVNGAMFPLEMWDTLNIKPGPGGSSMTEDKATRRMFLPLFSLMFEGLGPRFDLDRLNWVTVVALYPSSQIVAHRDPPPEEIVRYHIPLQTNPGCWCFHGGVWQQLQEAVLYKMNPREEHGAVNWGTEIRLHLMIDRWEEQEKS